MTERELFLSALEIEDLTARRAYVKTACAGNPELLARMESMLTHNNSHSQFLETPVVEQMAGGPVTGSAPTVHYANSSTEDQELSKTDFTAGRATAMTEKRDDESDEIPLSYLQPCDKPGSLGRLAHYEVSQVLGQGAFGIVLKAFDEKLQRAVAIKVLAPEMAVTSPARKRFLREARASAAIRHEHVVAIHAVDEIPLPYLVMEYIPGQTLQQRLDDKGPLDVLTVLRLGRQIAEGLAAAHEQDLIHRDIKPGNILLEAGVVERVKITDFGLARAADDASLTQSGLIAGTPMYMAPEQALGHNLDQRADLFSFGSVLYQMISGRPPFRAANTLAVLKRVTEEEPRPIQEIIPETPTWLCNIIARLMAKDPRQRYQTAAEVRAVLEAAMRSPDAAPVPAPPRAPRGRHAAFGIAGALVLVTVLIAVAYPWIRPGWLADDAGSRGLGEAPPAKGVRPAGDSGLAPVSWLAELGAAFSYGGVRAGALRPDQSVFAAAVYPANGQMYSASGWVVFWDCATGKPSGPPWLAHEHALTAIAYSPDGKQLATGSVDCEIVVWDAGGRRRNSFILERFPVALEFSADGQWLAAAWTKTNTSPREGWVRLWDGRTLEESRSILVHTPWELVHCMALSPDGQYLVAGSIDGEVRVWETATGLEIGTPRRNAGGVWSLAFDPSGERFAVGSDGQGIFLWDLKQSEPLQRLDAVGKIFSVACSRDGKWWAWGNAQGLIFVQEQGKEARLVLGSKGEVRTLAFTSDGTRLIAAGTEDERPPRVWDTTKGGEVPMFEFPND